MEKTTTDDGGKKVVGSRADPCRTRKHRRTEGNVSAIDHLWLKMIQFLTSGSIFVSPAFVHDIIKIELMLLDLLRVSLT